MQTMSKNKGGRGRIKPTAIKKLEGNPGKRAIKDDEPKPKKSKLAPPSHLTPVAKKKWKSLAPTLYNLGLLTELDGDALCLYCEAYSTWIKAKNKIKKDGEIIKTPKGQDSHNPWKSVLKDAAAEMNKIGIQFGFNPASRTKISVEAGQKASKKPAGVGDFEGLLN